MDIVAFIFTVLDIIADETDGIIVNVLLDELISSTELEECKDVKTVADDVEVSTILDVVNVLDGKIVNELFGSLVSRDELEGNVDVENTVIVEVGVNELLGTLLYSIELF